MSDEMPQEANTRLLRKQAGKWLRQCREAQGLSQRELAEKVGIEYYSFISQIEAGTGRLPIERYEAYAEAVKVPAREFTLKMLSYNEPTIYRLLQIDDIATDDRGDVSAAELERRLVRLEQVLLRRNG
ncbi:helix-turn-helix transcriptional regulator [Rhizobium sp. FKY42]|uniref:helix-turn-helix domain-containing protein n=1 Tax=Rhizobium sp. FKY42 TaxID=2562310 RepID=UPI0010BF6C39|nr:helix-turn-helix transcriptional regulator [Rhizobium sp. FKY42]